MKAKEYNHHWIELEFDSKEEQEQFIKKTSYKLEHAKYSSSYKSGLWDGTKKYLTANNKCHKGIFKSIYNNHPLVCDINFNSISFEDIPLFKNNTKYERRQYQLDAINTILKEKYGLITAAMGSGKTLIAAGTLSYHLAQNKNNKALFVCYDKNILTQSIKNFKDYGFNVSQFGDSIKDLSGDIIVATIQSLSKIKDPKSVLKNITFLFCDESHHSKSKTSKTILTKLYNCKYYIGLTATPFKEGTVELAELMSILGPVIFKFGFSDGVQENRIVPVKVFFLDNGCDDKIKEAVFARKNYQFIWETAVQNNSFRNELISKITNTMTNLLNTTNLILVDKIDHGEEVLRALKKQPNLKSLAMYGEDNIFIRESKKQLLSTDNINTLVSTVLTEGVDLKPSPVIAINTSGRKGFIKLIQFIGRITRPNPKFGKFRVAIDFIDRYNPILLYHSNERIKACKSFGLEVVICKSMQELLVEIIKYYKETKD